MQKYIVEATSLVSMADAAAQAMAQASIYLSENHDLKISVLEMSALKGRGYKVVLEVTLIPLSRGETVTSKSQDVEPKKFLAAKDQARRDDTDKGISRRIIEHFRNRRGGHIDTASIHLAQLTEDMLLGQITTEFMPRAQPVNLGPLNDPLAVQKAAPPPEPAADQFQQATQSESEPQKKTPPRGPEADPE